MVRNVLGAFGVRFWLFFAFSVTACIADTVDAPKALFGLGDVRMMALSPDQRFLSTAGTGGAFLWDVQSAALTRRLDVAWAATAIAFSPDSKFLGFATQARIVVCDPETGAPLQEFIGHKGEISRLKFAPGGQQVISASADNTVRVWSMEAGTEIHAIRIPGSPILDVDISADGQRLATVDTFLTNCVKIWDLTTETQICALPKTNWTAQYCLFTPAGRLVTAAPDRTVLLWDTETAQQIRSFPGITGIAVTVVDLWLPNEFTLAAACNDGRVYLWNLESAELLRVVDGEPVLAITGVPGESMTIAAGNDYNVRIRQLPGGDTLRTFKGHTTSTHSAVAYSPDGRYVLSGGVEASTRLWDRRSGQPIREFLGTPAGTMAATFSPDGSRILTTTGLPNPAARLWKTETGELEREFKTGSWPMSAVFSWDGRKVAVRSRGEGVFIYSLSTGTLDRTLTNAAWASAIAFAPNAPLLALASTDFTADVYNHESGQLLHSFYANAGSVTAVAFAPKGDTLMVAWQDGLIRCYNTFTMDLRAEFTTPAAFLDAATYSPDGQFILTGESWPSFTATLWDAQTAEPIRTFAGHKWSVSAVAFSADGSSILTGAEIVREWSIASLAARLRVERLGEQIRLRWSLGELQQATVAAGPWQTATNAISPFTVDFTEPSRFYRVRNHAAE